MALGTPTNKTSGGNATTSSSDTTASFTPTANALIFAISCVARASNAPTNIAISSTHTGLVGSWTEITIRNSGGTGKISVFYILAGASPSSGTITFTYSGASNPTRKSWTVDEVTGAYGVVESNTGESVATTLSIALASILTGNKAYGAVMSIGATGITEGTNETEIHEETSTGTAQARCQTEYGTEVTVDWSGLSSSVGNVGVALEIGAIVDVSTSIAVQAMTFSVPSYSPNISVSVSPAVQACTFSIPSYDVIVSVSVAPSAQSATFTIPSYSVTAIQNISVSPSVQSCTFSIPSSTVSIENPPTHSLDLEASSTQYVSIADASQSGLDLTGNHTVEMWIKLESLPATDQTFDLVGKYVETGNQRGYLYRYLDVGGTKYFEARYSTDGAGGGSVSAGQLAYTLRTGVWYHLTFTYSTSGVCTIYLNGKSLGTVSAKTSIFNNTAPFVIGNSADGLPYDGLIKDVRVFNDIRTQAEIVADAHLSAVSDGNLVAEWNFNNDYTDNTSNNNDLTATNSPVFSTDIPWENAQAIEGSVYLETSLVSFYPLNEASGTREDAKGSNDLTDNNTVASATGILSTAGDFEKSNSESLSIADGSQSGLDITDDISISAWIKLESLPSASQFDVIVAKEDFGTPSRAYAFGIEETAGGTTYTLGVRFNGTGYNSNSFAFSTGTWYHVAMSRSKTNGDISFYVNGICIGVVAGHTSALINSSSAFALSARYNSGVATDFFDGLIDEVGIWSRLLHYGDILDLYNEGLAISYVGPNVTVSPSVKSLTFSIPTYSSSVSVSISPAVQSLVFSIPAYTASIDTAITPSVQSATFTIPAYTVITPDAYANPAVQAMTFSIPATTVTAIANATISPSVQVLTFSTPEYSVTTTRSVTILIGINSLIFSIPIYRVIADFWDDKYTSPNNSYSDKYTPPSTSWSDKHSTPITNWNDKY